MNNYITQEVLNFFGIRNIFFRNSDSTTCLIKPLYIELSRMLCFSSAELTESGEVVIKTDADDIILKAKARHSEIKNEFSKLISVFFLDKIPEKTAEKILQYKKLVVSSEKRKETRYPVGNSYWKNFGLKTPNCTISSATGINIPCVLINVSVHGALVIGTRSGAFRLNEKLTLNVSFENGKIKQVAMLVNSESVQDSYRRYSLSFSDPVSLIWLEQVNQLSLSLEQQH